jgi:hypothetical protein
MWADDSNAACCTSASRHTRPMTAPLDSGDPRCSSVTFSSTGARPSMSWGRSRVACPCCVKCWRRSAPEPSCRVTALSPLLPHRPCRRLSRVDRGAGRAGNSSRCQSARAGQGDGPRRVRRVDGSGTIAGRSGERSDEHPQQSPYRHPPTMAGHMYGRSAGSPRSAGLQTHIVGDDAALEALPRPPPAAPRRPVRGGRGLHPSDPVGPMYLRVRGHRSLLHTLAEGGARPAAGHGRAGFAGPGLLGEELHVNIWEPCAETAPFQARTGAGAVILSYGSCRIAP